MKKLILTALAGLAVTTAAYSQGGMVWFDLYNASPRVWAFTYLRSDVAGGSYVNVATNGGTFVTTAQDVKAELLASAPGGSLAPVGASLVVNATAGPQEQRFLTFITAAGQAADFAVRAWTTGGGAYPTFASALAAFNAGTPGVYVGQSATAANFTVANYWDGTGPTPTTATYLTTLQPFALIQGVPEPSTIAFGLLGLAGLLCLRRK